MTTFTNSEIRAAILKAADHIERNPRAFYFFSMYVPDCGSPGCALGHIGANLGISAGSINHDVAEALGLCDTRLFYDRLTVSFGGPTWIESAASCARAMRLYADKYHPADKPVSGELPDVIKRIFAGEALA